MNKKLLAISIATILSHNVYAATTIENIQANAQLSSTCVMSASNIMFGNVNFNNANDNIGVSQKTTGTISVKCSKSTPYNITGKALVQEGVFLSYFMTPSTPGNTDKLSYNIWLNSNYSGWFADGKPYTNSGTGSNHNTVGISSTGTGSTQTHTLYAGLYGNIYPNVNQRYMATPDTYSDTQVITITY